MELIALKPKEQKQAEHRENVFKDFNACSLELTSKPETETALLLTITTSGNVDFIMGGKPDPRNLFYMMEQARDIIKESL